MIISSILAKLLPLVLKEVGKQLSPIKNEIIPIKKYVEEPNQNNVDIAKIKEDIIFIKNILLMDRGWQKRFFFLVLVNYF